MIGDWVLRVAVAVVFVAAGWGKFSNDPQSDWVKIFQQIGFGDWFRYVAGVVEIGGGVAFLVPRLTVVGMALLAPTMVGAMLTHIFVLKDAIGLLPTTVLLVAVLAIGERFRPVAKAPDR